MSRRGSWDRLDAARVLFALRQDHQLFDSSESAISMKNTVFELES